MTPNVLSETRCHKTTQTHNHSIMIALYTFSEETEPNGFAGKQEPGLLNGQQHPSTIWNADEVCMF